MRLSPSRLIFDIVFSKSIFYFSIQCFRIKISISQWLCNNEQCFSFESLFRWIRQLCQGWVYNHIYHYILCQSSQRREELYFTEYLQFQCHNRHSFFDQQDGTGRPELISRGQEKTTIRTHFNVRLLFSRTPDHSGHMLILSLLHQTHLFCVLCSWPCIYLHSNGLLISFQPEFLCGDGRDGVGLESELIWATTQGLQAQFNGFDSFPCASVCLCLCFPLYP